MLSPYSLNKMSTLETMKKIFCSICYVHLSITLVAESQSDGVPGVSGHPRPHRGLRGHSPRPHPHQRHPLVRDNIFHTAIYWYLQYSENAPITEAIQILHSTKNCCYVTFNILRLDFLTYCSYVKLGITLIKYVPQAVMNYRSVQYITVQCL